MTTPDPREGLVLRMVVVFSACFVFVATQSASTVSSTPSTTLPPVSEGNLYREFLVEGIFSVFTVLLYFKANSSCL